jgi:hypothetical protein
VHGRCRFAAKQARGNLCRFYIFVNSEIFELVPLLLTIISFFLFQGELMFYLKINIDILGLKNSVVFAVLTKEVWN